MKRTDIDELDRKDILAPDKQKVVEKKTLNPPGNQTTVAKTVY